MEQKTRVYIQYKPEHYVGDIALTIHCKESEFENYKGWFKSFIRQRELDLETINTLIKGKQNS